VQERARDSARARSRGRFVAGLVLATLAALGLLRWSEDRRAVRAAHPPHEGSLVVAGVEAPLWIVRDRRGVPHVRAANERDAWFALGFVHAQDRLAQMLWLRRVAAGRSAECVGAEGLASDREARTLDLLGLARRDAARQSPATRRVLEAYAAGVNARLARIRAREDGAPLGLLEPVGLIDPWAPEDSLALVKLMAWSYGSGVDEVIVLEQIVRHVGAVAARPFFPRWVGNEAVAPEAEPALDAAPAQREPRRPARAARPAADPVTSAAPLAARAASPRPRAPLRRASGWTGASLGSSAWVVAGALAARGRPLLAADAHLEPRFPSHLHQADLAGGSLQVAGATLPGVPAFWTGFNPQLAWASTGSSAVVADLFEETLHQSDPTRYADAGGWRTLTQREELISVRDAEPERLVVRATARGPLVDPLIEGADRPLALRWTGALPGRGIEGLLRVARARHAEELLAALAAHHEPALVVAYADAAGAGGLQMAGALPQRRMASGLQPVPSRNPAFAWSDTLAPDALPARRLGPDSDWVVASDRSLVGRESGIEFFWLAGDRARRIEALLAEARARGPLRLSALGEMLGDRHAGAAEALLALALPHAAPAEKASREEREVVTLLREWDRDSSRSSAGAAVYHVFVARLLRALFEPTLGAELLARYLALPRVQGSALALDALRVAARGGAPALPWTDPGFVRHAVRTSLREAWIALSVELGTNRERWAWGRLKALRFEPLWPNAWRGDRAALGPFPYGGDPASVAVAEHPPLGPWSSRLVSTWRFVADAGDLDQALTALAPGQSEHVGHANATDGIERWIADRLALLSTSDPVIEDGPVHRLALLPRE
jgi:penicillin amidase